MEQFQNQKLKVLPKRLFFYYKNRTKMFKGAESDSTAVHVAVFQTPLIFVI
jgi:hypothetical protein